MIQLNILSGNQAGVAWDARRFPVRIGRSPASDLRSSEDGVWDQHLQLDFNPAEGFVLRTHPDAPATVNGQPARQAVLRNGDRIQIGSLKLQFWLSQPRQTGLGLREWLTWIGLAVVSLAQIALIYWLQG